METHIMDFCTAIVAAIIIMILHEMPKTIVYYQLDQDSTKRSLKNALKVMHYIDPIGLIFCVATHGGFSKPYMYRIKDKAVNRALGITGFASLVGIYTVSVLLLKYMFGVTTVNGAFRYDAAMSKTMVIFMYFCFNLAFISFGMFLVNLFPISTFDMGNIVAGISPMKFFEFLRKDYFMKILLLFVLILGITASISEMVLIMIL